LYKIISECLTWSATQLSILEDGFHTPAAHATDTTPEQNSWINYNTENQEKISFEGCWGANHLK